MQCALHASATKAQSVILQRMMDSVGEQGCTLLPAPALVKVLQAAAAAGNAQCVVVMLRSKAAGDDWPQHSMVSAVDAGQADVVLQVLQHLGVPGQTSHVAAIIVVLHRCIIQQKHGVLAVLTQYLPAGWAGAYRVLSEALEWACSVGNVHALQVLLQGDLWGASLPHNALCTAAELLVQHGQHDALRWAMRQSGFPRGIAVYPLLRTAVRHNNCAAVHALLSAPEGSDGVPAVAMRLLLQVAAVKGQDDVLLTMLQYNGNGVPFELPGERIAQASQSVKVHTWLLLQGGIHVPTSMTRTTKLALWRLQCLHPMSREATRACARMAAEDGVLLHSAVSSDLRSAADQAVGVLQSERACMLRWLRFHLRGNEQCTRSILQFLPWSR